MAIPLLLALLGAPADFDALFTGRTLRFDYLHCGSATEERIAPDGFRLEGDWPGSRTRLLDDSNLGKYVFEVLDPEHKAPVFSRGFSSIFGEWETTAEAKQGWRAIHESQRFPEPRRPVALVLKKREKEGFREIWSGACDPASRFVDRAPVTPRGEVFSLFENAPPARQVDLLLVGEGYAASDRGKFRADTGRIAAALMAAEPYRSRRRDWSVRALFLPAAESGIRNPRKGTWRDSPLGFSFNAFDIDRYVLSFENRALREAAAQAPYDALLVLLNERKYGGGGIFGLWANLAVDSSEAAYLAIHEFGHSFAGLGDEYYSSQVAYEDFNPEGVEPWEPNVTALADGGRPKWADLLSEGVAIPTAWHRGPYDTLDLEYQAKRKKLTEEGASEEASEALMREVKEKTGPVLRADPAFGMVGAFEGAMYEAKGLYRPEVDCIMFTRNPSAYCRVCLRAVDRAISRLVD